MCVKPNMYYNIIIKIWEFPMLILIQYVNDGRSYLSRFLKFLVMSYFPRIAHDKINRMYDCAFLTDPKPKDVQNIVFDKWTPNHHLNQ